MVVDEAKPNPTEGDAAQSKKAAKKLAKEAEKKQKKAEHKVIIFYSVHQLNFNIY